MYTKWQSAFKYLRYYLSASNGRGHGIHSPFIFHFISKILADRNPYPAYEQVETLRGALLNDHSLVEINDLGAGSATGDKKQRSVHSIAKHAAKPARLGQLLFRIAKAYQPKNIIELGTSLGLTTSYLALGASGSNVVTLEGAGEVAKKARANFDRLGLKNVSVIEGNFDETLPKLLQALSTPDLCFIDGNHRRDPTLAYFNMLIPRVQNDSILVFDDIHWSQEMEEAWEEIRADERVRCSVDIFSLGLVFFREEFREKQDFTIRF